MKKFFLMLTVMFASLVASAQIVGTPFKLSPGGGCTLPVPEDAPRKFTFTSQWSATTPAPNSFDAEVIDKIVIEFSEPMATYFNIPCKVGGAQEWNAYNKAGNTNGGVGVEIMEISLEALGGSVTDFSIQHTTNNTDAFTIKRAYSVDKEGNESPIVFGAPGWGGSMQIISETTSGLAQCSSQWGGVNISDDILGLEGMKTLRIYTNAPLTGIPVQWCIKTDEGKDAWPQIGVSSEDPCYAECKIDETLQSIYLQWTSTEAGEIDIKAITWENELLQNVPSVEKPAVASMHRVEIGADLTADEHVQKIYNNQFSNVSGEITVVSPAKAEVDWDTQFWFVMKEALAADAQVLLTFDAKASSAQSLGFGAHGAPDGNNWKAGGVCDGISVTDEWQTFERVINAKEGWQSFALDLTKASEVTYDFKNIKIEELSDVALNMGSASYSLTGSVAENEYEGLTISYAENNLDYVLANVEGYQYGAVALIAKGAFLFEDGIVDAVAEEHNGSEFEAGYTTLFSSYKVQAGKSYTVVIPAGGLQLVDQYAEMMDEPSVYWTNDSKIKLNFTVTAPIITSNLVITEAGWATYCAPFDVDLTMAKFNATAYIVTGVEDDVLLLTKIKDGVIPAWQPVVLYGDPVVAPYADVEDPEAGWPTGILETVAENDLTLSPGDYVLQNLEGKVGFYRLEENFKIPAWKCYIPAASGDAKIKALYLDAAATAINKLTSADKKAQIFDVNGRQIEKLQKGINIVNGVKILVK